MTSRANPLEKTRDARGKAAGSRGGALPEGGKAFAYRAIALLARLTFFSILTILSFLTLLTVLTVLTNKDTGGMQGPLRGTLMELVQALKAQAPAPACWWAGAAAPSRR